MRATKKTRTRGISLLRALAIIAVIIFHISAKILPGGFLGVDLFFVISGYLTVSSFIDRYHDKKDVKVFDYLYKKFKKLSPALYTMIIAVLIFLVLFNKPVLENSHLDAVAGLTYTSNIWYIIKKVDYFNSFGANPFNHLWYLGVQFHFYIIMILLVKLVGIDREKRFDTFAKIIFALFIASFVAHVAMFKIDNINRIYYGTDTRLFEFFLGVLAGKIWPIRYVEYKYPLFKNFKGLIAVLSIGLFIFLTFVVSQYSFWLYKGGFLLVAILSLIMLYSTNAFVKKDLSNIIEKTPFSFIGDMSYDLYIWHYPVVVLTQTASEVGEVNALYTFLRMIAVTVISLLVKEFVVDSINRYSLTGSINRLVEKHKKLDQNRRRRRTALISLVLLFTIMGVAGKAVPYLSTAFLNKEENKLEESFQTKKTEKDSKETKANQDVQKPKKATVNAESAIKPVEVGKKNAVTGYMEIDKPKKDPKKMTLKENIAEMKYKQLVLIGDSLAVNVGPAVQETFADTIADGKVSRQLYNSADVVAQYAEYDSKDTALIFLLGTNGVFLEEHIDELIASFKKADIFFVNVKVPQVQEKQVNEVLKAYCDKNAARATLIDWYGLSTKHPEYFEPDKTHLNKKGVDAMVKLIFEALSSK